MEPEVHIIEKYFQEILHCFTMTNIRCKKGKEIDLLAVDPRTGERYHVESRIGTSPSFKIREKDTYTSKGRPHKIGLDYFKTEKFDHQIIKEKILALFGDSNYRRILVVWNTEDNFAKLPKIAEEKYGFELWGLRGIILTFMKQKVTTGSRDDILRVMELVASMRQEERAFLRRLDKLK